MEETLAQRYAPPPAWRRPVTVVGVVVVAALGLGWLLWAAFVEANPKVESELVGWSIVDAHTARARVDVTIQGGTTHPRCTLQALASDHTIVGELAFTPRDGTNVVTVRTERRASAVNLSGCTADGQDRPR